MEAVRTFWVLVRFQLQSGARVALRSVVPLAVGLVAAAVLSGSPLVVLAPAVALLFPADPSVGSSVVSVAIFVLTYKILARRLTGGVNGWILHLPATRVAHRRAITMGLQAASIPIILYVVAAGLVSFPDHAVVAGLRIAAVSVVTWGSALSVSSVRPGSRLLAVTAGALSFFGTLPTFLIGIACMVVADLSAGPIRSSVYRSPARQFSTATSKWRVFWAKVTIRALGTRYLGGPGSSILVLGPLALFLHNNSLSPYQESLAVRFFALTAGVVALSIGAESLASRRPPWPWARSLPVSSGSRVAFDLAILGATTLPTLIVAGVFDWTSIPVLVGVLPFCALRAASEVRTAPGRSATASGRFLLEGGMIVVTIAVLPWATLVIFLLTPLAYRAAVRDDQSQDVSRWHELHYLAAGDSLSWSDQ